jgi:hypothetical protein
MQNNLSLQDAFPGIVVANHLVNANAVTEVLMNMSKPFMNKELASKVRVMHKLKTTYLEGKCLRIRVDFFPARHGFCAHCNNPFDSTNFG